MCHKIHVIQPFVLQTRLVSVDWQKLSLKDLESQAEFNPQLRAGLSTEQLAPSSQHSFFTSPETVAAPGRATSSLALYVEQEAAASHWLSLCTATSRPWGIVKWLSVGSRHLHHLEEYQGRCICHQMPERVAQGMDGLEFDVAKEEKGVEAAEEAGPSS